MEKTERVSTGVKGLDGMMQGGFPKGSAILTSGSPGTGKTTLGLHFLYEGAKDGKKGLYLIFEEKQEQILKEASAYFSDFKKYVDNGLIKIYYQSLPWDVYRCDSDSCKSKIWLSRDFGNYRRS